MKTLDHSSALMLVADLERHKGGMFRFKNATGDVGGSWRLEDCKALQVAGLRIAIVAVNTGHRKVYEFGECVHGGLSGDYIAGSPYPWTVLLVDPPADAGGDIIQRADQRRDRGLADIFG